jgi:thiol-disulfide isomerase/thioredoxin
MSRGRKLLGGRFALCAAALAIVLVLAAETRADEASGIAVGKPMEDFGLRQLDFATGKLAELVWLSDFVGTKADRKRPGKLLLLNFFATWCKPCMAELPVLTRLQNEYGPHGLKVLSINYRTESEPIDATIAASRKQWQRAAPPFPVLFDRYTNRNQLLYMGARAGLPCNILIDEQGVVRERFQGGDASALEAIEASIRKQLNLQAPAAAAPAPAVKASAK